MIKVFFDASVIFSSIYSKTGGSFYLVSLAKKNKIIAITSQTVIQELEENIDKLKIKNFLIKKFIAENSFLVREEVDEKEIKPYIDIVNIKDAHVIAAAISTNCKYLVTLDKKHLDNPIIQQKIKNLKILSPKNFLILLNANM